MRVYVRAGLFIGLIGGFLLLAASAASAASTAWYDAESLRALHERSDAHAGCSCSRCLDGSGGKANATATAPSPTPNEPMKSQL